MTQFFTIHPQNPQKRLLQQAVEIICKGGVIVYPTDSCYALGCHIENNIALKRIRQLRAIDTKHHLTLICKDLSEIGTYAKVHNTSFRLMKSVLPAPYTFILIATNDVPNRLQHAKRKTIGVRVPNNRIVLELLTMLGSPMLTTSLILPGHDIPMNKPAEIIDTLQGKIDLVIDGGVGGLGATTVVDLVDGNVTIVRQGMGDITTLGIQD